jgi:hypothetical protein
VALQDNPSRADLSRLLVAADAEVDPHLLVGLCCERAADDPLSVSLLVPADDDSGAWSEGSARAVRLVGHAAMLLDAEGLRLEDVIVADEDDVEVDRLVRFGGFDALLVCAPRGRVLSSGLSVAVRSARLHGLTVLGGIHRAAGPASWLRRVFDPLGDRPESAA